MENNCHVEKIWDNLGNFGEIMGNFGRFCHNLLAFMWRKIEPKKYICGERMTNMRSARPWPVWQLVWGPCSSAQWGRPVPEWQTCDGCTKCTSTLSSIEIATSSGWGVYSQLSKFIFSDFLKCGLRGPAYSCPTVDEHLWGFFRILLTVRRRVQRLGDPSDGW